MTVIALEGLPGTGKTSLLTNVGQDPSLHVIPIGEHVFPEYLFALNTSNNDDNEAIYELQWETKDALCHLFHGDIVSDRSYVTCLAYNYAKSKVEGKPGIYDRVRYWMEQAQQQGRLHLLDLCIVLNVEPTECNRRKQRVETPDMLWSSLVALQYSREFYSEVLPRLPNVTKRLEFVDANRPYQSVLQDVGRLLLNAIQ